MNKQYSVLVIEDDPSLLDICKIVLDAGGYRVSTATNGLEGIAAFKANMPDLILLDLYMPVMNGREFLRNFNKADFPDIKIIVYSNASEKDITSEMLELGADDVVLKSSISPRELNDLVGRMLGRD